jgi:hypothetical protein
MASRVPLRGKRLGSIISAAESRYRGDPDLLLRSRGTELIKRFFEIEKLPEPIASVARPIAYHNLLIYEAWALARKGERISVQNTKKIFETANEQIPKILESDSSLSPENRKKLLADWGAIEKGLFLFRAPGKIAEAEINQPFWRT